MARPKKTEEVILETQQEEIATSVTVEETKPEATEKTSEPTSRELELMRLYPQYDELWITPRGFVHHKSAPKYLTKGAKLFKNKFYKNK